MSLVRPQSKKEEQRMIQHQPIASIAPIKARHDQAARELRALLDSFPPNPYSEEETNALIEEAIAATRGQYPGDVKKSPTTN
jgi:hypothetical protein